MPIVSTTTRTDRRQQQEERPVDRHPLELQVFVADGLLRLSLTGALVDGTTARLRTWMHAHVPATTTRLLLDLSGVDDVDAVGLGALLAAPRRLAPGAEVLVEGASPAVTRQLRQCGLHRVLQAA